MRARLPRRLDLDFKSVPRSSMGPRCSPAAIYLRRRRFAYLRLMKQGFNFLPPEINITLLEQMGGGRMGSMKTRRDNGAGSAAEWPEVIKLRNFHTAPRFYFILFIHIFRVEDGGKIRIKWRIRRLDGEAFNASRVSLHARCKVCGRRCAEATDLPPRPQKLPPFHTVIFGVRRLCRRVNGA